MLPGAPTLEHPVWIEEVKSATSDAGGLFYPARPTGGLRRERHEDRIRDRRSRENGLRSPRAAAGVVLYICAVPSMKKGDTVANVGVLAASPP